MDADWFDLPELKNLGDNLLRARLARGFSQARLARECHLGQAQISLFEVGRRLPSLDQFVRLARALSVPLQRLMTGSDQLESELKDLATELQILGASDLWIRGAAVPGAARRPEEVIALAATGRNPDPRVVETLPALLSWNEFNPTILRAHGFATKTTYRLAWLADIALTIERQEGFPGGCRRSLLERFLKIVKLPPEEAVWDDLGRPSKEQPVSPIWKRWKVSYATTLDDFKRRATELASSQDTSRLQFRPGKNPARQSIKPLEEVATLSNSATSRKKKPVLPRKEQKGKSNGR